MRVAYIGNVGSGSAPHSTENEIRKALEALDIDVVPIHEQRLDWSERAVPGDTTWVMWTHTHGFAPPKTHSRQTKFLEAMRRRGVPTVGYHLDRWFGLAREHQVSQEPFFRCDVVCTADGGHQEEFEAAGVNHVWFLPAVSEFECEPGTPRDEYRSDVAFVGSWQGGYHPEWTHRQDLVDFLRERARFWPEPGKHAVRGSYLRDLYASVKVLVGDSCLVGGWYISDRVPESLGRGGLLIHPRVEGVTDGTHYVDGEHLLCWGLGDWDELASAIDLALTDDEERARIAKAGREHVLANHTYTVRMRQLIELLTERCLI